MLLSEEALFSYINCPLLYQATYMQSKTLNKPFNTKSLVKIVINYYMTNLFNGKVKTKKELQIKWDSLCEEYAHVIKKEQVINGWSKIVKATQWCEENRIIVADVGCKYNVLTSNNNTITGLIDYILIHPNKKTEILYFDYGETQIDKAEIEHKLKYTLDYFGFYEVYGQTPDFITIHNIKYNKTEHLFKIQDDQKRLFNITDNICKSIENSIFYPRETYFCKTCPGKYSCNYWST